MARRIECQIKILFKLLVILLITKEVYLRPVETMKDDDEKKMLLSLETPKEILNNSVIRLPSRWERGMEVLGQLMDALRFGTGRLVNLAMMARNIIAERAEEFTSEAANKLVAVIAARDAKKIIEKKEAERNQLKTRSLDTSNGFLGSVKKRETAVLETENNQGLLERRKPGLVQDFLASFVSPTPLVDGIREEEKYGNSGEKFNGIGRALVNTYEGFSNFINKIVDIPGNFFKQSSIKLTENLNQVGAKLIGLQ